MTAGRAFRFVWEQAIRDAKLGPTVTAVALVLSTYANADGTSIHPGEARVADGLGTSRSTVTRALQKLRGEEWLTKVRDGNSRTGQADEYRLSLPDRASPTPHDERPSGGDRASPESDHASPVHGSCVTRDAPPAQDQLIYTNSSPMSTTARRPVAGPWARAAEEAARAGDSVARPVASRPSRITRPSTVEPAAP